MSHDRRMTNFNMLLEEVEKLPTRKVAAAVAHDETVIAALAEARRRNIAESVLVGDEREIRRLAEAEGLSLEGLEIADHPEDLDAVDHAVRLVNSGEADILMKGYVQTDDFLRGILHKEHGLRTGSIMSHVFVAEHPEKEQLVFVTDGAMNIAPDLEQKACIMLNAVYLANLFGIDDPRVGVLAAVEQVNPKMSATMDGAMLAKMSDRRQFVPHCRVDGPFALDNAVSELAAKHKKIGGEVAGRADILLAPDVESGNMLAKALTFFGGYRMIGLLIGARAPVVLTSRADNREAKLISIAGAVMMVNRERRLSIKVGKVHF